MSFIDWSFISFARLCKRNSLWLGKFHCLSQTILLLWLHPSRNSHTRRGGFLRLRWPLCRLHSDRALGLHWPTCKQTAMGHSKGWDRPLRFSWLRHGWLSAWLRELKVRRKSVSFLMWSNCNLSKWQKRNSKKKLMMMIEQSPWCCIYWTRANDGCKHSRKQCS